MAEIKRENFLTYFDVSQDDSEEYALLGDGIESASLSMNGNTEEKQYIHQGTGLTLITSYRPTFPFSASLVASDEALAELDRMRRMRVTMGDAERYIINVWKYLKADGTSTFEAERQRVSVEFSDYGGDGGGSIDFGFTLNYVGDPDLGTFNMAEKEFTKKSTIEGTSGMSGATTQATPVGTKTSR